MILSLPAHIHGLHWLPQVATYTEKMACETVNLHLCASFPDDAQHQSHIQIKFLLDLQVHENIATIVGNCGRYVL